MKKLIILLVLVSSLFGADIDWPSEYKEALVQAKKENKHIYMLITANDCRWCRKFERTTLQDPKIIKALKEKYVLLHIDREMDMDDMPSTFKSKRVPRHYFLDNNGEVIYTFLGYWDSLDFNSFLDDVDKEYKTKEK